MSWLKRWHRRRLQARPFPRDWSDILAANVPYYRALPAADQEELRGHMQVFLEEKRFEGCGGLEVTDEMRVVIAAQACILLLHRDTDYFPGLRAILVYPDAYRAESHRPLTDEIDIHSDEVRLGESHERDAVVLSWEDVKAGLADIHDGENLVLHEFAHQLDAELHLSAGAADSPGDSPNAAWARVLGEEYDALAEAVDRNRPTVIDPYGAENPAEFFAVVTECFFEKPHQLEKRHPELYEQLRLFYRQDPRHLPEFRRRRKKRKRS